MSRLRIRVELSRGGAGVPLHKLASVIEESQKFLSLLTEDVQVEKQPGEWLGFDFDRESLNFTAEYVGPVTTRQMEAFNAAFDGTTSLRRDTIAQFLRITEAIGEDEVIGFGLYHADDTAEPAEWRCLSRRDAWRIAEEVQILMGAGKAPHLPAVSDPGLGARMFGDRRNRNIRENRVAEYVREMESGLTSRIQRVESQVQKHSGMLQDLQVQSAATETSFRNLLSTFETFCNQATRNIERMSPSGLPAAASALPAGPSAPPAARAESRAAKTRAIWMAGVGGAIAMAIIAGVWLWPENDGATGGTQDRSSVTRGRASTAPATVAAASVEVPAPRPVHPVAAKMSPVPPVSHSDSALVPPTAPGSVPAAPGESGPAPVSRSKPGSVPAAPGSVPVPRSQSASAPVPAVIHSGSAQGAPGGPGSAPAASGEPGAALVPRSQPGSAMEIGLDATEPTWVSIKDQDGKTLFAQLLDQGARKTIRLEGGGTLRAGNAGGLAVRLNGNPIGPLGPSGGVRQVEFKDGKFTIGSP